MITPFSYVAGEGKKEGGGGEESDRSNEFL